MMVLALACRWLRSGGASPFLLAWNFDGSCGFFLARREFGKIDVREVRFFFFWWWIHNKKVLLVLFSGTLGSIDFIFFCFGVILLVRVAFRNLLEFFGIVLVTLMDFPLDSCEKIGK